MGRPPAAHLTKLADVLFYMACLSQLLDCLAGKLDAQLYIAALLSFSGKRLLPCRSFAKLSCSMDRLGMLRFVGHAAVLLLTGTNSAYIDF